MKHQILTFLLHFYLKIVFTLIRWKIVGLQEFARNYQGRQFVLLLWHGKIVMPIYFLKQANSGDDLFILSSSHGGLAKVLDSIALKNGIHGIIKGSNNRNSYGAMSKIVKTLESGKSLCITPDGPRGPRMILKNNNIIELAIKLNIPIATCNYAVKYSKSLRSWDRMMLPLPLPFNKGIFYVKEITNQSYYMQHNNVNDVAEFVSNEMNRISNICHKYCGIKKIKPSKYSYKRKRK